MGRSGRKALRDAGALVRERRWRSDLSQRELARTLGVTQPTVSDVELGKASPTLTLAALRTLGRVPRQLGSKLRAAER